MNTDSRDIQADELFDDVAIGSPIDLPEAVMKEDRLIFLSPIERARAYEIGAFSLQFPLEFDPEPGRLLASQFYLDGQDPPQKRSYSGYRRKRDLCFWRSAYKMEQLIISREDREEAFPIEARDMARQLDELSTLVLRDVLRQAEVEPNAWDFLTGNAASNSGTHWFVANSYRPSKNQRSGCSAHEDTGFVTLLFTEASGLEGLVDGKWCPINPKPGYLIVNFGLALEMLTRQSNSPISALMHRVRLEPKKQLEKTRISFAAFSSAPTHGKLYELDPSGRAHERYEVDKFLMEHDLRTWREDA